MPSSSEQLFLHERGIESFEDLTPEKWHEVYHYKPNHVVLKAQGYWRPMQAGVGVEAQKTLSLVQIEPLLRNLIQMALFYRSRIERPDLYWPFNRGK